MILVTGGTGLVGAYLLLHLADNEMAVRAIYRSPSTIEKTKLLFKKHAKESLFSKIEWVQADILDIPSLEIAFQNIDYVYHCAGLISFDSKDEALLRKINIEGTANIVNFCLSYNVKKLCHVSSTAALGEALLPEYFITEDIEWNPELQHSDYAISKYGAEMEVWRGYQEGLSIIIVNPGVILGSTLWTKGSGAMFLNVKKRLPFYTNGKTGFVSAKDVVVIMTQLMRGDFDGERYCIVSQNWTYAQTLKTMANTMKVKKPFILLLPWMSSIIWRLDGFRSFIFRSKRLLNKQTALSIHAVHNYSNHKIKNALNYEFQSIDECIKEIIAQD